MKKITIKEAKRMLQQLEKEKGIGGQENYEIVKRQAEPYLAVLNNKGREIAKKYGKKFYPIAFNSIGRIK